MSPEFRKHLEFLEPRFTELRAMADDAGDRALMEIYAAITLRTPYNDFENH